MGKGKSGLTRGNQALVSLSVVAIGGFAVIIMFAQKTCRPLTVFSVASMVAAAAMLAGGLFGFLFGIPRTLQQEQRPGQGKGSQQGDGKASEYAPNTNLEQISDWLTKLLLGAGLAQASRLRDWLANAASSLGEAFGVPGARPFGLALLLSYGLIGFLAAYLWTRLYFAGALSAADFDALAQKVEKLTEQSDLDASAIILALRQLDPSAGSPGPSQLELDEALKAASSSARAQIFYRASSTRSETRDEKKKKMERTIPIFNALIASDVDGEYHANHAELGFALKDKEDPDWAGALAALDEAIKRRGRWQEKNSVLYEFNRAICKISLDKDFKQGKVTDNGTRESIVTDLKAAYGDLNLRGRVLIQDPIKAWCGLNSVKPTDWPKPFNPPPPPP